MRAMRLLRPALCLYAGLVLSICYTTVFGSMGAREYALLERRARALEANLRSLERVNQELTEELRSLSSDPETIALLARDLGYYRRGDRRVAVQGLPLPSGGRAVGTLVMSGEGGSEAENRWRLALFILPIATWALLRIAARIIGHGDAARRS